MFCASALYKVTVYYCINKGLSCVVFDSFTEMPTNNFVESSFWNFDALFQPQQHPARDAHDTFFVSGRTSHIDLFFTGVSCLLQIRFLDLKQNK